MRNGHKIITNYDYPPIPDRSMDWSAVLDGYDGAPDASGPCSCIGRGPTEASAVADLIDQIRDLYEASPNAAPSVSSEEKK